MQKNIKDVIPSSIDIKMGKKTYKVKASTLGDISSFQRFCDLKKRQEYIDTYKMAEQPIDVKEIMSITGDELYYQSMMNSMEGIIHLLYKNIHRNNKTEITEEQISNELDIEDLKKIVEVLFDSFIEPDDKDKVKNLKAKLRPKK